jgi:hypothetical protein
MKTNLLLRTISVMLRLDNFRWSEFFLCRNTAMGAAGFSPFKSVNIVRCGSKICSSRRAILIHQLYMKLVEPPTMFWEILLFFKFYSGGGEKPRCTSSQKAKDECTRRNPCPSVTLFTTKPIGNNPIADRDRRYAMFHTPTHNSLTTVEVVQF